MGRAAYVPYVATMTTRRGDLVDSSQVGVYHCISRCVRRQRLLSDPTRREWLCARLRFLCEHLATDVLAFAAMESHLHLLLRTRPEIVEGWSDREVATRRVALLPNQRRRRSMGIADDAVTTEIEIHTILSSQRLIQRARHDLSSLGFFHRLLKQPSARRWNREDGVTGHFWEGRFKSLRVLDETALLDVAVYIELNQIYACTANSIPGSCWTSAREQWQRLCGAVLEVCAQRTGASELAEERLQSVAWEPVLPCRPAPTGSPRVRPTPSSLTAESTGSCALIDYIARIDEQGRRTRPDKPGFISSAQPMAVEQAISRAISATRFGEGTTNGRAEHLAVWWRESPRRGNRRNSNEERASLHWMANIESGRGSCYGRPEAAAREALRRGCAWVVPIRGSA